MSKILFFYVLRSFAVPALICLFGLCALTLLFMSFDLIGACFDAESVVTWRVAMDFLWGTLSIYLEWLLPAVFLLATLYTMWQFCRHSELIAMRAGGIGMGVIVAPIVLTAFVMAGLSFINTEFLKPVAATRAMSIKNSDFRQTGREPISAGFVAPGNTHEWNIGRLDLIDIERLEAVSVTFRRPDGSLQVRYEAPEARWIDGEWWLQGGVECRYYDELDRLEPERTKRYANLPLPRATETPRQILAQNFDATLASFADRKADRKTREQRGMSTNQKNADSYATYNHFAAPFAIVLVTLFAIPAGIASGRQSVFRGILLAIALFIGYYAVTFFAMFLSNNDIIKPALAVTLPCIVFAAVSVILFKRLP